MLSDLILKNRSYRRFDEKYIIGTDILYKLVDLARLSPSARNAQPLKYILANKKEQNALIFPFLAWAGYLTDWDGPDEGERPSGYIIMLGDKSISENYFCDHGIAAQSILLGATEIGLGGCIIMSINKLGFRKALNISEQFDILMVIALGKPVEQVVIEPISNNGNIKYWRSPDMTHHVPKRELNELIISLSSD